MKKAPEITLEFSADGHTVAVSVTVTSQGIFWAEWENESYQSESLKGLRVKLLKVVRPEAKRVEIPVLELNYDGDFRPITLIGLHAGNGNVLYLDGEGKTQQSRYSERTFKVLTEDEMAEYRRLQADVATAGAARIAWLQARRVHAGNAIRKAMGLKLEKVEKKAGDDDL